MPADPKQQRLLFGLSAVVPADNRLLSKEYILYFGFSIGFSCQADSYKFPAQQQAVNGVKIMTDSLQNVISELKEVSEIGASPELYEYLEKITLYSDNDQQAAFLLGQFFKNKFELQRLPPTIAKQLKQTIKRQHLNSYFYLNKRPENEQMDIFSIMLLIGGLTAIVIGIIRLISGDVVISKNIRYLGYIFDNGGYKIILGLVLFISGLIRFRHEKRKVLLLKNLKFE